MNIKAKLRCTSVTKTDYNAEIVKLQAVYGDSEENKSFSAATPSASVEMTPSPLVSMRLPNLFTLFRK